MIKFKLKYGVQITLGVSDPETSAIYTIDSPNPDLAAHLRSDLEDSYGMHGKTITNACSAISLRVALSSDRMQKWGAELVEGQDILDSYKAKKASDPSQLFAKGSKGKKKGLGAKNCNKGTNCGGTCISAKRKCRKDDPTPAVKTKAKKSSNKGGGGGAREEAALNWRSALTPSEVEAVNKMVKPYTPEFDLAAVGEIQRSGTAKLRAGTGSNKSIDADLAIVREGLSGHSAKDLDAALDSIPGAGARVAQLRQFVNDQQIKVVFNDLRSGQRTETGDADKLIGNMAKKVGADPYYVEAKPNTLGYTTMAASHVQVVPEYGGLNHDLVKSANDIKNISRTAKKGLSAKPFTGNDSTLYTYLHEVGHQVDFKSRLVDRRSGRDLDPATFAPTRYAATNKNELFAESFALYMIHGPKYAKAHPETAAWVKERLDWVTTKQ